ncbi:putative Mg2+ transporter-C (MgtC) family protein [Paenibacillus sp. V4I3]|uniref:MgtC/SapB family protein n=1 Tax=unclassified Paenibacillus TaxID=185978 RepID=UPI002780A627|nr:MULTISPECIES: MgtC/SapB family protein [unclassified Paenibacillus]MDQ0878684.1 putative Mg2+ transporter-C (MgtC) family protein [Paenibacillus sp. V4I3]MDQ0885459.1 putative Mg2+ transporter-C (MgtC) family protein [Paenibacillus sp. V4I9]
MSSVWQITDLELTIRILLAVGLGGLVGLEREWSNHAAGLRTHILVCIGSAAIMLLSIYGFSEFVNEPQVRIDPARLAAQVISGIGFLGAGTIMRTGLTVSGLTTAASVWVVAAIGLCVGAGFLYCAVLATVMVLLSLIVLNKWEKYLMRNRRTMEVVIKIVDKPGVLGNIATKFGENGIHIVNVQMKPDGMTEVDGVLEAAMELRFSLKTSQRETLIRAMDTISTTGHILSTESKVFSMVSGTRESSRHAIG